MHIETFVGICVSEDVTTLCERVWKCTSLLYYNPLLCEFVGTLFTTHFNRWPVYDIKVRRFERFGFEHSVSNFLDETE